MAAAEHETDPNASLRLARQAFEADPALVPASVAYARRLREGGRRGTAQDVLRRTWSLNPHPDIAAEYVRMAPNKLEAARELAVLVRANPSHAESHIAIGRAALDAGLTNEARKQVEQAQAEGLNQRRLWTLLADIAVMEGKPEEAQEALRHVPDADPTRSGAARAAARTTRPGTRSATCATRPGRSLGAAQRSRAAHPSPARAGGDRGADVLEAFPDRVADHPVGASCA